MCINFRISRCDTKDREVIKTWKVKNAQIKARMLLPGTKSNFQKSVVLYESMNLGAWYV